jgi:hypothetical protein
MFDMVEICYQLKDVFEAICNSERCKEQLAPLKLSSLDWLVLKSVIDFLSTMKKATTVMSCQKYSTLSMQPKIYELMVMHCKNTINGHSSTKITKPQVQQAAQAVFAKLKKYERNLCSDFSSLALVLHRRNGNGSFVAAHLKETI